MIVSAKVICLMIACILLFIAAFIRVFTDDPRADRFNLIAAGLFFFMVREMFP